MDEVRGNVNRTRNVNRSFVRTLLGRFPPITGTSIPTSTPLRLEERTNGQIKERIVFMPTDVAIISLVLGWKVRGKVTRWHEYVKVVDSHDVYGGGKHPWDIFSMCAEDDDKDLFVHLFTTPPTLDENGNIGAWKVLDDGRSLPVKDPYFGNRVVGYMKNFIYDGDGGSSNSNQDKLNGLLMTLYTTLAPPKEPSLNYVLCKIEKVEFEDDEMEEEEEEEEEEERDGLKLELETRMVAAAIAGPAPARAA